MPDPAFQYSQGVSGDYTGDMVAVPSGGQSKAFDVDSFDTTAACVQAAATYCDNLGGGRVLVAESNYDYDASSVTVPASVEIVRHGKRGMTEVANISDLRDLPTTDGSAAYVRGPGGQSGVFVPFDSDPFGNGDDGATAVQASDGAWWVRKLVPGEPVKGDWFSGSDAAAFRAVLDAASAVGVNANIESTYDLGDSTESVPSGVVVEGSGTIENGTLDVSGTALSTSSDLSADAAKGDSEVTVADGSKFTAGDVVEITASPNRHNNDTKLAPRELHVVEGISTNTLTLETALKRDFITGFTTEPNVTVISTVDDAGIDGPEIGTGGILQYGHNRNLTLKCKLTDDKLVTTTEGACQSVDLELNVNAPNSTANVLVQLYNVSDVNGSVVVRGGGKDGVRIWGVVDATLHLTAQNTPQRALWFYKTNDAVAQSPRIEGSQTKTVNVELLLLDYCKNLRVQNPYINEPNKTGSVNTIEYRGVSDTLTIVGGEIHGYSNLIVVIKNVVRNAVLRDCTIYAHPGAGQAAQLQFDGGRPDGSFLMAGCHIKDEGAGGVVALKTKSNASPSVQYQSLVVRDLTQERLGGTGPLLDGDGTGSAISRFTVDGYTSYNGYGADGSIVTTNGIPIEVTQIQNVRGHQARDIRLVASGETAYIDNVEGPNIDVYGANVALINGVGEESSNADTPQKDWPIGSTVKFTDTGDGSGTGTYILSQSGSWISI
jgi:hypothetical protein